MKSVGAGFVLFGIVLIAWGFGAEAGVDAGSAGRVANLSLLNFKLLLVTTGTGIFISGWVLVAADYVCVAIMKAAAVTGSAADRASMSSQSSKSAPVVGLRPDDVAPLRPALETGHGRRLDDLAYRRLLLEKYPPAGDNLLERNGFSFNNEDAMLIFLDEMDRGLWPSLASATPSRAGPNPR
jgi:hypothetical protein